MSELRWDPLRFRWVIIATERGRRPGDFEIPKEEKKLKVCPFCYGQEEKTPKEVFAVRRDGSLPNTPGWKVRVVPNRFPALRSDAELTREGIGLFDRVEGVGAHEVVIETPHHEKSLGDLDPEDIALVLLAYRERIRALQQDPRIRYILVFKNHRAEAGASLSHSHSQIIATPVMPFIVRQELMAAKEHFGRKERCIFCDIIKNEQLLGHRVIADREHFFIWAPYASCFPFETWLFPKKHRHDFALLDDNELLELAYAMKTMLAGIKYALNDPPYNFVLHTSPVTSERPGKPGYWGTIEYDFHWHIELIPRLTHIAGFEWGSGFYINPTPPEMAAEILKEALACVE